MKITLSLALAASLVGGAACAADLTPTQIVERHTASGGNVDKIMADYADDAVVFQQGQAIEGKAAIRALFARMFGPRPPAAAPPAQGAAPPRAAQPTGPMKVTRVWEEGHVGFMTWEAGPVKGTDEFLVKNGKIAVQVVYTSGGPATPPAG